MRGEAHSEDLCLPPAPSPGGHDSRMFARRHSVKLWKQNPSPIAREIIWGLWSATAGSEDLASRGVECTTPVHYWASSRYKQTLLTPSVSGVVLRGRRGRHTVDVMRCSDSPLHQSNEGRPWRITPRRRRVKRYWGSFVFLQGSRRRRYLRHLERQIRSSSFAQTVARPAKLRCFFRSMGTRAATRCRLCASRGRRSHSRACARRLRSVLYPSRTVRRRPTGFDRG